MLSFQKKGAQHLGLVTSLYMGSPFWSGFFSVQKRYNIVFIFVFRWGAIWPFLRGRVGAKDSFFIDGGGTISDGFSSALQVVRHFTVPPPPFSGFSLPPFPRPPSPLLLSPIRNK